MERFMLLFRGSEAYNDPQPPAALEAIKEKMISWVVDLSARGIHLGSEPLERDGRCVTGNEKILAHAPYGEEAAIVGGCTIIRAHNIDEAVDIAGTCPILTTNATIEIRPVQTLLL